MPQYRVHVYREMRLVFEGVEADTPQAAAHIAAGKHFDDCNDWSDCEGTNLAALVDEHNDVDIDEAQDGTLVALEDGRWLRAGPRMLAAVQSARELFYTLGDGDTHESRDCFRLHQICDDAIAHAAPGENWYPIDIDGQNEKRGRWAKAALQTFMDHTGVDYEDALGDLICDLLHVSDREPFDFDAALERARGHYAAETGSATY
jgi:hypothetical protein